MRLASRFGSANLVPRDRPLIRYELAHYVPSIFSEDKHESRSDRYTCIPTITLLDNLQLEGFEPFFACQTKVRDQSKREHTKHMLRLRRTGQITGHQVPEIILLNSHDGSSSYQMLQGLFRSVCQNGLICGQSFGEVRVPHRGNVVEKVIEGAYEVLGIFDRVEEKRDAMQSLILPAPARQATVPDTEQDYVLFNELNGNGATVSREAAGVVACLMMYSHHACRTECDAMTEHYYRLRDYALSHPECSGIMHIID